MRKLIGLQYLRAFAALGVLIFHAAQHFGYVFAVGSSGVDLFFVISGFLMVAITTERTRPLSFLMNRVERIVPLYWLATTVALVAALAGRKAEPQMWHTIASYLFIPARLSPDGEIWPVLIPGWTLNYEMFFYVSYAALLLLGKPVRAVAAMTLLFGGLAIAGSLVHFDNAIYQFYTHPIILEFVMGAWIALYWKSERGWPGSLGIPLTLLAVAWGSVAWTLDLPIWRPLIMGIPAVMLVIAVLDLERAGGVKRERVGELLGDASYSIYIWHGLAIMLGTKAIALLGVPAPVGFVLSLLVGTGVGLASYLLIERPLIAFFKRRRATAKTVTMVDGM